MPGITGIIAPNESYKLFDLQVKSLNHYNYIITKSSYGRYHTAVIGHDFSTRKIMKSGGVYILTFFGDIFGSNLFPTAEYFQNFADQFVKDKGRFLAELNGQFQGALYDIYENCLYLFTDRSGSRPIYYYHHEHTFNYACEVKALLKNVSLPRDLNEQAIAELFSLGFVGFKNTLFKNIYNLGAAQLLSFRDNSIQSETYYSLPYDEEFLLKQEFTNNEINTLIEKSYELLDLAVRNQIDHKIIFIALSGGLDSRFITALAQKYIPGNFTTYTFGNSRNTDILYAREVAKHLSTNHVEFMVDPRQVWEYGRLYSYLSDGMSMINGPIQAVQAVNALQKKNQVLLAAQAADAMWGSSLSHNKVNRLLSIGPLDELNFTQFNALFEKIPDAERKILFEPDFLKDKHFDQRIFEDHYESGKGKHPFYMYQNLLYFEYTRRGVGGGNLLNNFYFDLRMPSFDKTLLEFITNLPIQLRRNQFLYRKTFIRYFPGLAKIRRNDTGLPIDAPGLFHLLKKKERKLVQRLRKSPINQILKHISRYKEYNYVDYKSWFRNELNAPLKEILFDNRTLNRPFYRKDGINQLYEKHMHTDTDYSKILWQIINLEYFFRNFMDPGSEEASIKF